MEVRHIILRETLVSMAINAAISAAMFMLVFGLRTPPVVTGAMGYANDFLPQIFMIALMSSVVPGLLTMRRHRGRPRFLGLSGATAVVVRSLIVAVGATAVIGGALAFAFQTFAPGVVPSLPALGFKVLVGALVAFVITPVSIRHVLRHMIQEDRQIG